MTKHVTYLVATVAWPFQSRLKFCRPNRFNISIQHCWIRQVKRVCAPCWMTLNDSDARWIWCWTKLDRHQTLRGVKCWIMLNLLDRGFSRIEKSATFSTFETVEGQVIWAKCSCNFVAHQMLHCTLRLLCVWLPPRVTNFHVAESRRHLYFLHHKKIYIFCWARRWYYATTNNRNLQLNIAARQAARKWCLDYLAFNPWIN